MKRIIKAITFTLAAVMFCSILNVTEGFAKEEKMNNKVVITNKTTYSAEKVTLRWERIKKVSGYQIYRKQGKKGKYELVNTISGNKKIKWTDTSIESDKVYFYKIRTYKKNKTTTKYGRFSKEYKKSAMTHKVQAVIQYTNVPYVGGGYSTKGWDCSGFTKWALREYFGVDIPKAAAAQGTSGKKIGKKNRSKWQPGDVLVYSDGKRISHVALYLGDGKLMHALSTKYGTIIQDVSYYERWDSGTHLVDVRRFAKKSK